LTLGVVLSIHGQVHTDLLPLNQNIAAFCVMSLPVVILAAWLSRNMIIRIGFGLLALDLLWSLYCTRNRGACVALVAAVLVLWLQSRRKLIVLALGAPLLLVGGMWFAQSGHFQRFTDIWQGGPNNNRTTAFQRLDQWKLGWQMACDHPWQGVGLENYSEAVLVYAPGIGVPNPHNQFVMMLAETGFPGLVLYSAFFVGTAGLLWRLGRDPRDLWPSLAARYLLASLAAWLCVGFFLGLHSHAPVYVFAGASVALSAVLAKTCESAAVVVRQT